MSCVYLAEMTCGASVIGMNGMHTGRLNTRTMALVTQRRAVELTANVNAVSLA